MAVVPPTLTAAGLSPDRADRATFVARSIARDDFIKNTQIPQLQTAIDNVYNNAVDAYNQASAARIDSIEAATSASQAASAATAIQWVSGTTYAVGDARWSPATKISYRRLIAGAGTADPSADATNWAAIVMPLAAGGTGATTAAAARAALDIKQLQSIDYTLAGNALTLKLNPTNRDYRSTLLLSGAPVNVSNAAQLTLTISSGSSLGTVSGVQSDIAIISINNAGTMELAAVNIAGGASLAEEGVISTVAEGGAGAADSATVFYSNTARTGVAYRLEGIFRSTQTVAGTWAQAPTLVQPVGGQALAAMSSFGFGQTRQNVSGSRTNNTIYYNTTGKPIFVSVTAINTAGTGMVSIQHSVGGVSGPLLTASATGAGYTITTHFVVLPGQAYNVGAAGTGTTTAIGNWEEVR